MEQEETKTTAAAGVEMPPEAESWVQLHESELTELMQKQAKAAITELKRQEKQERNLYSKTLFVSSVGARKKKFIIFLDFVFKQTVAVEC